MVSYSPLESEKTTKKSFDLRGIFYILLWLLGIGANFCSIFATAKTFMVPVVQLVRTPGCDSGGRGFETLRVPHFFF